jgi:hypothetical protein
MARLQGSHRSVQRGRGLEFEEVRLYAPGDDARNIDWKVTARRGRAHTKLFREERERPVWLIADLHAGLFFGSRRQLKSALLLRAAAMLSWAAALGGDRVGAVIAKSGSVILPPRAREAGVLPILQALVDMQPHNPGMPVQGGLQEALSNLGPLLQPGSMVLMLSDFSGMDRAFEDRLANIAEHSDCRMLWITDPLEAGGLPNGTYRVGLPDHLWWMSGDATRSQWQRAWHQREKWLQDVSVRHNLPLVNLSTHLDAVESVAYLLKEPAWAA